MAETPRFDAVHAAVRDAARRLGGALDVVGEVDGYPILRLRVPGGEPSVPRIWLSAGIHGEEPGSVAGLLRWLERDAERWQRRFAFTILPCLSPYGYERGERLDRQGRDPNRLFRRPEEPLVAAVERALADDPALRFAIDMHEDSDFTGFYMYELTEDDPAVGPAVVEAVAAVGEVAHGRDLEPPVEHGIVLREGGERLTRERLAERENWPIAFRLFLAAGHVVTLETPGRQPIDLRAEMQRTAVEAILRRLAA
jgi:protein MpaA